MLIAFFGHILYKTSLTMPNKTDHEINSTGLYECDGNTSCNNLLSGALLTPSQPIFPIQTFFAFPNNFLDVFHSCKQFIFVSYSTINLLFRENYTTRQLTFLAKPLNKLTTSCFDFFGISLFIRSINNFLLFFEIVAYWLPICTNNACSSLLQLPGVLELK